MLTLYHAGNSVCSIKVRLALEEAGLDWTSVELNLPDGEQFAPEYLALNPAGVVPTLVHDGRVLVESSIILDYVASIGNEPSLISADPYKAARARLWGLRGLGYHAAVNTISFASFGRLPLLAKSDEEREEIYSKMPDPEAANKRRDLVDNGVNSPRVHGSLQALRAMCDGIEAELAEGPWMAGEDFTTADIAVAAYVYRTECAGLSALWTKSCPAMRDWWEALKSRPAFERTVGPWVKPELLNKMRIEGEKAFGQNPDFAIYF